MWKPTIYRMGKSFLHTSFRFPSGIFIMGWIWALCHMIYTVKNVTKRLDRLRRTRNQRLCWLLEPDKIFDGLPNSSFERVPLPPLLTPLLLTPVFLESHSKRTSRLHNIEIITAFALNFHISRFPGSRIFEVDQISGGSGPSDKGGDDGGWPVIQTLR